MDATPAKATHLSRVAVMAEGVEVVGVGGDFGEGAGAVGGNESVAEVLKDGDVVSGGSAFANATA